VRLCRVRLLTHAKYLRDGVNSTFSVLFMFISLHNCLYHRRVIKLRPLEFCFGFDGPTKTYESGDSAA